MRPPRSPTIVGSAVETIVWSSDASRRTSISAAEDQPDPLRRLRCGRRGRAHDPRAGRPVAGLCVEPLFSATAHRFGELLVVERGLALRSRAFRAETVEKPVQMAPPGRGGDLGRRVDHRGEGPEHEREIGNVEVGSQDTLCVSPPDHLLEQLPQLLPRFPQQAFAGRVTDEDLAQNAVSALKLERRLQEPDEARPRVGLLERAFGEREELVDALGEDRLDERAPVREVAVQRRRAHPGAAGNLVEAGIDAVLRERRAGSSYERRAVALRISSRSRLALSCTCHALTLAKTDRVSVSATVSSERRLTES